MSRRSVTARAGGAATGRRVYVSAAAAGKAPAAVNRHFTIDQKIRVIEPMWQVAHADDDISAHERHLMRRIVDLLHVPHGDAVAAQTRARESRGR